MKGARLFALRENSESMDGNSKVLVGKGAICRRFCIGKRTFHALVDLGMPARKMGKIWMCHIDSVEEWFRSFTSD